MLNTIEPKSGTTVSLKAGQRLKVVSPEGQQVSDLFCFNALDYKEAFSSSRTMDEAETLFLSLGHNLVSNRGRPMLTLVGDTCGRHDLLMPPCRESENGHPGCFENLSEAFQEHGLQSDDVGTAFNIFMHVEVSPKGQVMILTPQSVPGDEVIFEAKMDVLIGLTACAHLTTNGGRLKPIQWQVL